MTSRLGLASTFRRGFSTLLITLVGLVACPPSYGEEGRISLVHDWDKIAHFQMAGGLNVFWNVNDGSGSNAYRAVAHGFKPITLLNTFSDYPGAQKESIYKVIGPKLVNSWVKPDFFERIIRRNIAIAPKTGVFVHDIELGFEEDIQKTWSDPTIRAASGASSMDAFGKAYLREVASWFTLPAAWTKEARPGDMVGIYGPQPFRRDYWGLAGKSAKQIDGTHARDDELWAYIDRYVDMYIASIYLFFDAPGSVYYMASNVEENFQRTRKYGDKPVFAYTWMRFHYSSQALANREIDDFLVEAMAIVPYFSGAKSIVLWGYEPKLKAEDGYPYEKLPLFTASLARVAGLSDRIGRGRLVFEGAAHELWRKKLPLVRRVEVAPGECIVMATNPWQADSATSTVRATCSGRTFELPLNGRHVTLADIRGGTVTLH